MARAAKAEALALIACKVAMRAKMRGTAKAVFAVLLDHHNWTTGRCDPGMARIAKLAGCSVSGVRKAIGELVDEQHLLKVTTHGGGADANRYEFDWEEIRKRDRLAQQAMGYAPNGAEGLPQTGQGGMPQTGHQTRRTNPLKEPLGTSYPETTEPRPGKSTRPRGSEPTGQRYLIHGVPGGKATSRKQAAENAPLRRSMRELAGMSAEDRRLAVLGMLQEPNDADDAVGRASA